MKRKVLLIYTGGTIGMEKDYETGSLVPFNFENIFGKIPEMKLCLLYTSDAADE